MKKKGFLKNLKGKFKIVILHPETYEEKGGFDTSRSRLTTYTVLMVLLIIAATTCLIFFTPIRELIPGYTDVTLNRRVYEMERRADSIELVMHQKDQYIENMRRIIYCDELPDDSLAAVSVINKGVGQVKKVDDVKSKRDSLFRAQFESASLFNIFSSNLVNSDDKTGVPTFVLPLSGVIVSHFDAGTRHYGTDLMPEEDAVVNAVADGMVVFSDLCEENKYVVVVQHANNIISVYKNTASLLRYEGDMVHAGDALAVVSGSGKKPKKTPLHFELWHNGAPLNAEDFISFDAK